MIKIKQIRMVLVSALLPGIMVLAASTSTASEFQNIIEKSISHAGSPLLFPNPVIEAYTDTFPAHTHFLVYKESPDDPMPASGLRNIRNLYNSAPQGFVKFESATSEKKEKSLGIPSLFKWLGWVCRTIFVDINEDGDIDAYGVTFVMTD